MLIVQISDTHISLPGKKAYGIAPTAENLIRCVHHVNELLPKPDLVLVTGDISNTGVSKELEYAASILNQLKMPYYVIPGNHDDRSKIWNVFGGKACPSMHEGFINYVIDTEEIRFIAVDSTVPQESGGEICEIRASWLDKQLALDADKPTLIFMHHPPVKCGVIETDIDGFIGIELLANIVQKYSNIESILCGHIHTPAHTRWHGTIVSTAPSMGLQLVLDLTLKQDRFTLESASYQLHYWTEDKNLITHTTCLHENDGPHSFKEFSD